MSDTPIADAVKASMEKLAHEKPTHGGKLEVAATLTEAEVDLTASVGEHVALNGWAKVAKGKGASAGVAGTVTWGGKE